MTVAVSIAITLAATPVTGVDHGIAARTPKGNTANTERVKLAQKLNRGLRHTPMRGLGYLLEREGRAAGIHPAFIAAAAGLESSYGAHACYRNPRNVWGLGSCGRSWQPPYFDTWREAIHYYARFLRDRWPSARTPYDFHGYCECGASSWGSRVAYRMRQLGFPAVVRYSR